MGDRILTCFKWGDSYGSEYVNALYNNAHKFSNLYYKFVCVTDNSTGLNRNIDVCDLNHLRNKMNCKYVHQGNWQKILLYSSDLFRDDDSVVYMDLDVVIVGSIDDLFCSVRDKEGVHICANTKFPKKE